MANNTSDTGSSREASFFASIELPSEVYHTTTWSQPVGLCPMSIFIHTFPPSICMDSIFISFESSENTLFERRSDYQGQITIVSLDSDWPGDPD